jgi:hypothetical protein
MLEYIVCSARGRYGCQKKKGILVVVEMGCAPMLLGK